MNIFRVGNTSPGRCACSLKDLITNRPSGLDMIRRFSKTLEAFLSLTTLDGDKWIIFKSFHHLQSFFPLSLHVWICLFGQSPLLLPWFLPYFSQGFFASSTSSLFSTLHPKINMLCFKAYFKKNSSQFLDSLLRETRLQSSWFFSISPCVFHFSRSTILCVLFNLPPHYFSVTHWKLSPSVICWTLRHVFVWLGAPVASALALQIHSCNRWSFCVDMDTECLTSVHCDWTLVCVRYWSVTAFHHWALINTYEEKQTWGKQAFSWLFWVTHTLQPCWGKTLPIWNFLIIDLRLQSNDLKWFLWYYENLMGEFCSETK